VPPCWLHRLAGLTALATLALISVGALVTSTDSGMAFRDWPLSAGRNLFSYPWFHDILLGAWKKVVEHGHRLGGAAVGILTLALAFSLWARDPRRPVKVLGLAAAALVLLQGILGGFRVVLDDRILAFLHACAAHAFFALSAAIWVLTSPDWLAAVPVRDPGACGHRVRCAVGAVLAYAQIALGAAVRQLGLPVGYHLGMAAVLVVFLCGASLALLKAHAEVPALRRPATAVAGLVLAQSFFGLTAWYSLWSVSHPRADLAAVSHTVIHVATGALLLGAAVSQALKARRWLEAA
jgi:cytochrome c oxidase assembly protein subunit 15